MNIISLANIRAWLNQANRQIHTDPSALDDIYLSRVVESLNYCKTHPDSSKCENLLI